MNPIPFLRRRLALLLTLTLSAVLIVPGCGAQQPAAPGPDQYQIDVGAFDEGTLSGDLRMFESATNQMFSICYNIPELLASVMSAFPTALAEIDVDIADPEDLNQRLSKDDSGELRNSLTDKLRELLENPATRFAVFSGNGEFWLLDLGSTENASELTWKQTEIHQRSAIYAVRVTYADGTQETGYFYLPEGFLRVVPIPADSSSTPSDPNPEPSEPAPDPAGPIPDLNDLTGSDKQTV